MRRVLRAVFLAACLALPWTGAAAEPLVPGFEDLPVMAGLDPLAEGTVRFDSPGGRIVVAYLRGEVTQARIFAFYDATLAQLGWTRRGQGDYQREGEGLRLELLSHKPVSVIRFTLAPAR